jgi:hypothetical protein
MASHLAWNGEAARVYARGRALRDITRVVAAIRDRAVELLSVPGPAPSAPGEPPHTQTGNLIANVDYSIDERTMTWRVGTPVIYGLYLETGTRRGIAPRPWLRPAMAQVIPDMDRILEGGS